MLIPGALGGLCGLLLGRRHTVFILIPAHVASVGVAIVLAAWIPLGLPDVVVALASWSVAFGAGYVAAGLGASPGRRQAPPAARSRLGRAP